MGLLQKQLKEREHAATNSHQYTTQGTSHAPFVPQYDVGGRAIVSAAPRSRRWIYVTIAITASLLAICGFIYLPQYFIQETPTENAYLISELTDREFIRQCYIELGGNFDWDRDGVSNAKEYKGGTNLYTPDTDGDHVVDAIDEQPTIPGDGFEKALINAGMRKGKPYEMNGVTLWADDETSMRGGVVATMEGYYFSGFKGWAKFGAETNVYAYKYSNGIHTLLPYRAYENAWKISEDCLVLLKEEKMEMTNQVSFFGASFYVGGWFGDMLSAILPNQGFITSIHLALEDTFIDTDDTTEVKVRAGVTKIDDANRVIRDDGTLSALAGVYQSINNNVVVYVSLYEDGVGESLLMAYGYTKEGYLLVADPKNVDVTGILFIQPVCKAVVTAENTLGNISYFEYCGCGYDSTRRNTTISFTASAE